MAACVLSLWWLLQLRDRPFAFALAWFIAVPGASLIAYQLTAGVRRTLLVRTTRIFGAGILGCLGVIPLGFVFDRAGWPIFHSWGLGHGAFVIALPILWLV